MHLRLTSLYDCSCESCHKINLAASSDGPTFKSVLKAAENAFKHLHEKGGYKPEDITDKPYQKLINETAKVFDSAVTDNEIPAEMLAKLHNDTFVFSGLRTHAQLLEASTMLMEDGKIRGFDAFANDFNKVNTKYNQNYLEAEWQFAVSSSQSAGNWAAIDQDGRYNLQYRTANDDRVRADHAALQDITLPTDDPFWMSYYPPNGWRCRCTAVEVLQEKYTVSDSEKANAAGDRATTKIGPDGKNRSEIFRFNPGMEQKVFPPKHPYNKVKGAEEVKKQIEKPIEYKKITEDQFSSLYAEQKIKPQDEKRIMSRKLGYIATSNSFDINQKLRKDANMPDVDQKTITALDNLIAANPLKDNYILHRNVSFDFVKSHFGFYNPIMSNQDTITRMKEVNLKSFSDKGFCSTSAIEKQNVFQNRKFHLEIKAKKGTKAYISNNIVESEIVLARNQKFNIIDIVESNNDRIKIIVETD
ncbi:ADP-ribosyltransferase [Chryseobacterium koreense]